MCRFLYDCFHSKSMNKWKIVLCFSWISFSFANDSLNHQNKRWMQQCATNICKVRLNFGCRFVIFSIRSINCSLINTLNYSLDSPKLLNHSLCSFVHNYNKACNPKVECCERGTLFKLYKRRWWLINPNYIQKTFNFFHNTNPNEMTIERNSRNSIYMTNFTIGGFDAVAAERNIKASKRRREGEKKNTEAKKWKPELMCVQLVYGRWDKYSIWQWNGFSIFSRVRCHLLFGFLCR